MSVVDLLTKENFAVLGVAILFIWKIIDAILKLMKKREHELEKLAFEMAKIKLEAESWSKGSVLTFYYYCLTALRTKKPTPWRLVEFLKQREQKIDQRTNVLSQFEKKISEFHEKIKSEHKINWGDLYEKELSWKGIWRDIKLLISRRLKKKAKVAEAKS